MAGVGRMAIEEVVRKVLVEDDADVMGEPTIASARTDVPLASAAGKPSSTPIAPASESCATSRTAEHVAGRSGAPPHR